jgi:hypothetical protein
VGAVLRFCFFSRKKAQNRVSPRTNAAALDVPRAAARVRLRALNQHDESLNLGGAVFLGSKTWAQRGRVCVPSH